MLLVTRVTGVESLPRYSPLVGLAQDKWCGQSGCVYIYPMGASHSGQLPKWPNGADCKSAVRRLRGFESLTAHLKPARVAQR